VSGGYTDRASAADKADKADKDGAPPRKGALSRPGKKTPAKCAAAGLRAGGGATCVLSASIARLSCAMSAVSDLRRLSSGPDTVTAVGAYGCGAGICTFTDGCGAGCCTTTGCCGWYCGGSGLVIDTAGPGAGDPFASETAPGSGRQLICSLAPMPAGLLELLNSPGHQD